MREQYVVRIRILLGIIMVGACVLIVRLYDLQIVHGEAYRSEANNQYVRSARDIFDRGAIYFTEKTGRHVAAASTKAGYLVAINPEKIGDPAALYTLLEPRLSLEREDFFARAQKKDDPYEEIAHRVEPEIAESIEKEHLLGVQTFREQWRYYPGGVFSSHILGFVGFGDEGTLMTGKYGLERYWESVLARQKDVLYVNFFAELFANVQKTVQGEVKSRAGDIVTSIEPSVQRTLEQVLSGIEKEWNAREIAGIILDPKTGDVYALAALPTFDPNSFEREKDARVFRNPLVENVYEMGSIVKPLAMAIGLDTGAVRPETTYNDTGNVKIDGYTISNFDGRARGVVSMQEVLGQSLNVGMAFVAGQVGREKMGERIRALGFGEETGIDLPFEAHGLIDNLKSTHEVEYATAAFGQGIALTPIAMARALCALGNGGYLVTPHIVKTIEYKDGGSAHVAPDEREQVFSQKTSEEITRMLVTVVDKSLRNGAVKKEHYSIAAKTGTAQIAKKGERGYYDDRYLHSFFGYFPAYDPRFLIFLFQTEPKGAQYASETLTAPFMQLVDFLINYYQIPPDR